MYMEETWDKQTDHSPLLTRSNHLNGVVTLFVSYLAKWFKRQGTSVVGLKPTCTLQIYADSVNVKSVVV